MSNPLVTLANMFTNTQATVPAAAPIFAAPSPANAVPAPVTPGNPANPSVPVTSATGGTEPKSPLADYETLWQNDPKNIPKAPEPLFNIDPAAIAESAKKVDFRTVITPEIGARMKAGGDDGMAAMMEAMNSMSQLVFAKAAQASAAIAQEGISKAEKQFAAKIPAMLVKQNLRSSLQENPVLSNPAAAPLVALVSSQIQHKYPNATEAELRAQVSNYFDGLAKMMTEQATASSSEASSKEKIDKSYDFSNF